MKRCLRFFPFETSVPSPEVGIVTFASIGHPVNVEELDSEIECAHFAIFLHMANEFVLEAIGVLLLGVSRRVLRRWDRRILHNVHRSVAKRHVTPITQLLIRLDCLMRLNLHQRKRPYHF